MTRIGINPARGKDTCYRPSRVTVAMITYIPHLSGYFEHRLQVLRLSLSSLVANTTQPYDLLVFDNGSCQPVIDYLQQLRDSKIIDYLLLSRSNIGKIGAFNILFNAAPGEIVAYSDDDIFFYTGWLEAHLEIIEKYPHVGMVTGLPVHDASDRARNSLDQLIVNVPEGLTISIENNIPEEWEVDWALSTGRDPHIHLEKIRQKEYVTLSYKGVEAFGSASHFQFVSPRRVIVDALPEEWSGQLMGAMVELDEAVDQMGYLRLSTVDRYTRHLGNILSDEVMREAQGLGLAAQEDSSKGFQKKISGTKNKTRHWLLRLPGSRRWLNAMYNRLFEILYG